MNRFKFVVHPDESARENALLLAEGIDVRFDLQAKSCHLLSVPDADIARSETLLGRQLANLD